MVPHHMLELFKSFQPFKTFKPPRLTLPRVTGENKRGGFRTA